MKKRRVIIMCAVIVAVLSALAVWQRNNLEAIVLMAKPETDLSQRMQDNDKTVADALSRLPGKVRDLTEAEKEALEKGELTEAQAAERICSPVSAATSAVTASSADKKAAEKRIAELVAKVYVLRGTYVSQLEGLKSSAIAEYRALPENQRGSGAKKEIAFKYIGKASSLEAQCDGQMTAILAEMSQLVDSIGGDKTIVADVKSAYAEEKALKKAYYLRQYTN